MSGIISSRTKSSKTIAIFYQFCFETIFLAKTVHEIDSLSLFVIIISSPCCSFVKSLLTFCLCRCEICNSVGSSKWLMVHPPVILRQAGEYVHFAWFPSSIFQTSPELGVTQLEKGFQEKQQHKWKSRPR